MELLDAFGGIGSSPASCVTEVNRGWWDDITEAADLLRIRRNVASSDGDGPISEGIDVEGVDVQTCRHHCSVSPSECCFSSVASSQEDLSAAFRCGAEKVTYGGCQASAAGLKEPADVFKTSGNPLSCISLYSSHSSSLVDSHDRDLLKKTMPNLCPSQVEILASKLALNSGKEHVKKCGRVRRARFVKSACPATCRRCESPRLSVSERVQIFQTFWSLSCHEDQWMYIFARVRQTAPPKRETGTDCESKGKCSRMYHFLVNGVERRVCKTMFKNTLCICDSWIDSAMVHLGTGKKIPDMRGKHRQKQGRLDKN